MNFAARLRHPSRESRIGLAYFCVFLFWGSTYLAIRIGVSVVPPALLVGIRFLLAGSLLLLVAAIRKLPWPSTRDLKSLSVVGVFLFIGGNGLVAWSEQWVPSGLAALIIASTPLFMSSLDSLIPGGHGLPALGWIGIAVGFAGVALLVSPGMGFGNEEHLPLGGIAGLVGASLSWSIGSIYSKRRHVGGHMIACIGIEMLVGGAILTLVGLFSGEASHLRVTAAGVIAIAYLVLMGSIVGFTAYTYLLRHVPAAKASTYAYVNPIVAVILGAAILAEPFDARMMGATVIILGGVGLVQMSQSRRR